MRGQLIYGSANFGKNIGSVKLMPLRSVLAITVPKST